ASKSSVTAGTASAVLLALTSTHADVSTIAAVKITDAGVLEAYEEVACSTKVDGTFDINDDGALTFTPKGEDVTVTLNAGLKIAGTLNEDEDTFTTDEEQEITGIIEDDDDTEVTITVPASTAFDYELDDEDGTITLTLDEAVTGTADDGTEYTFTSITLTGSEDVTPVQPEPAFDSADVKVYSGDVLIDTVTFTSRDTEAKEVKVSSDITVSLSFDLSAVSVELVSVDGKEITSSDGVYSFEFETDTIASIFFTSGDASFEAKLSIVSDDGETEGDDDDDDETYLLDLDGTTFKFTGSNGQSASFTASTDVYSTSSDLASVDADGAWGTMTFNVSSDIFYDFIISVDFPASASVAATYYKETAADTYETDSDAYSAGQLEPTEGYYKLVFKAGLIASSDGTASGDGYFDFTIQVVSVDAGTTSSDTTSGDTASGDTASGDTASGDTASEDTLVEVDDPNDAATDTDASGNAVVADGQTINTQFLGSNGAVTAAIAQAFFSNATPVEPATPEQIEAALETLGLTADDMGNATEGYKVVGLGLPSGVTLTAGMKFFVMISSALDGTGNRALGMGILSSKQIGLGFLPIVFKLLKNPANTSQFMTFDAGSYYVGATNDMASSDSESASKNARVVFVTAAGDTFSIAADEPTLLQGQTASGDAKAVEESSGDDDDDEHQATSKHGGGSSGCDAGFGLIALAAIALAARKIRK
ncbi:MAG: hypothetical protein IJ667_03875, partial [Synergistaceae bacterium]|nr:hypothetical protein [Synergistaceae bacterium]